MEAALLTGVVTGSLTLYTFWAVKRGSDFSFLGPFLFASLMVMLLFSIIQVNIFHHQQLLLFVLFLCFLLHTVILFCWLQVFFPLGPTGRMFIAGIGALIMCGFIVYDTDDLIKRYTYDDYIWAAIAIYGDILNLFIYLLTILNEL